MVGADRVVWLLVAATLGEAGFAAVIRVREVASLLGGRRDVETITATAGMVWLVVLLAVMLRTIQRLRAIHGRVATLTMSGTDWYWESDEHLVVTYSSASVMGLLGYPPEQVVGRSLLSMLPLAEADRLRTALARSHATGEGWEGASMRWRHANGSLVDLVGSALPIVGAQSEILGFRGTRRPTRSGGAGVMFLDTLRARISDAIQHEELRIALQPIVNVGSAGLCGVEALARFSDGRSPAVWFSEAQQAGLAVELELCAASLALRAVAAQPVAGYLSLNVSPRLLEDPRFESLLQTVPELTRLVLEVTEHAAVARYDVLTRILADYRARGLRVAVDDTGAGYASFNHVLQLRPDIIKIDRSVVSKTVDDAAARALVAAVVRLAAELDAETVGEGVETEQELHTLSVLGVTAVQGYLLARPSIERSDWQDWQERSWPSLSQLGERRVGDTRPASSPRRA